MEFYCKAVIWQILANIQRSSFPVSLIFSCHGKFSFFCWSWELDLDDMQVKQPNINVSSTDS